MSMVARIESGVNPAAPVAAPVSVIPAADSRQDDFQRSVQRIMGQQLQGDILSRLNDGSFLVKIAGTAARMMLPAGTEVGDSLPMTLVSTGPRPTFLLGTDASGVMARLAAQQGDAAATVSGKAAQTTLEPLSTTLPSATGNTTLSNAGRLINQLLYTAQQGGAPTAILGKEPLVNSPAAGAEHIASALQNAVTASGVFYESHVVDWADGNRSLSDLMKEPQSQSALLSANAGKADPVAGLQPDLAQIINLQLNTLENQRLQWQGEVWPGQPMEWEISKDAPDKNSQDDTAEENQAWQSTVRFNLPSLGTISASIRLIGEHLHIQVRTVTEETASSLRAHAGKLADALGAAGASLDSLTVKQDERA
jgi:hypothetical protein